MRLPRLLWFVLLPFATPAANAYDLFQGCEAETVDADQSQIDGVAKADNRSGSWVVYVNRNSRFNYLSYETLDWLFQRQCYFAANRVDESARNDLSTAEKADCEAVQRLRSSRGYSEREARTIEYDLETLTRDANEKEWRELLGPRRSFYLLKCF